MTAAAAPDVCLEAAPVKALTAAGTVEVELALMDVVGLTDVVMGATGTDEVVTTGTRELDDQSFQTSEVGATGTGVVVVVQSSQCASEVVVGATGTVVVVQSTHCTSVVVVGATGTVVVVVQSAH